MGQDAGMALELRLCDRGTAQRVMFRRRDPAVDPPWADEYPLEGDTRAVAAYVSQLPRLGGDTTSNSFGYYQVVEDGVVVGGIGFHGPPKGHVVEVGYGVVPAVRGRGVATAALRLMLEVARGLEGVGRVVGRTDTTNVASQRVMMAAGMYLVTQRADFWHYEIDLEDGSGSARQAGVDPGSR